MLNVSAKLQNLKAIHNYHAQKLYLEWADAGEAQGISVKCEVLRGLTPEWGASDKCEVLSVKWADEKGGALAGGNLTNLNKSYK